MRASRQKNEDSSESDERIKRTLKELETLIAERDALRGPLVKLGLYEIAGQDEEVLRKRKLDSRLQAVEDKDFEIARKRDEYLVLLLASTRAFLDDIATSMDMLGKDTKRLNRSTILLLVSTVILVAVSVVDFLIRLGLS